jgi:hypothetical protein
MDPQQRVEADEMIHVHMADEHVADAQQVPRAQGGDVTGVEQQRFPAVQHPDEEGRVAEAAVDEPRVEHGCHRPRSNAAEQHEFGPPAQRP